MVRLHISLLHIGRRAFATGAKSYSSILQLRVGGRDHILPTALLEKYPDSLLGKLALPGGSKAALDRGKVAGMRHLLIINRDRRRFQYIIDFYRKGEIVIPKRIDMEDMKEEVDYFELPGGVSVRYENKTEEEIRRKREANEFFNYIDNALRVHDVECFAYKCLHAATEKYLEHKSSTAAAIENQRDFHITFYQRDAKAMECPDVVEIADEFCVSYAFNNVFGRSSMIADFELKYEVIMKYAVADSGKQYDFTDADLWCVEFTFPYFMM
jgi:hypothetical protein